MSWAVSGSDWVRTDRSPCHRVLTPTSRCQRCIRNPTNQLRGYAEFAVDTSRINFQHPKIIPVDLRNKVRPETTWMVTCGDPRMETLLDKPLSQDASLDSLTLFSYNRINHNLRSHASRKEILPPQILPRKPRTTLHVWRMIIWQFIEWAIQSKTSGF